MKLFIQIPCHNEEKTLSITLAVLPKNIAVFVINSSKLR